MKFEIFTLTIIMLWLWVLLIGDAQGKNDVPLLVYAQKGEDAVLHLKTNNPLKYARIGTPKQQEMNTEMLYIRVAMENASLAIVRGVTSTNFGERLAFHGDLSHGAFFTISNVTRKDNATKLRILYQELGKGAEKQDYLIIIVEALTSGLSPSVVTNNSSGNASDHPSAVHKTINTTLSETRNDTDPAKSTPSREPSTSLYILLVIPAAVLLIPLLIVPVRGCMKLKNKIEDQHQVNEWDPSTMDWFEMGGRYQPGVQEEV